MQKNLKLDLTKTKKNIPGYNVDLVFSIIDVVMNNDPKFIKFQKLAELFSTHGHFLYLVGGSVRDYLLHLPLNDLDVVTDATPKDMKTFLEKADYTFERFGSVKVHFLDEKFDITTLRKENGYGDYRHPNQIIFTTSIKEDVSRRDFTINALYLSKDEELFDLVEGEKDLKNKIIRMIGDPEERIKQDPLRIIRGLRFKVDYDFKIEENTFLAFKNNKELLKKLNIEKVKQEINKCSNKEELIKLLNELDFLC